MFFSELTNSDAQKYDIIAETEGMIACLPYGEIKSESRKFPHACYLVMELAAKRSLETIHFNVYGHEINPVIRHVHSATQLKKIREFFFKNQHMREFL